jgi:hypothetical protein
VGHQKGDRRGYGGTDRGVPVESLYVGLEALGVAWGREEAPQLVLEEGELADGPPFGGGKVQGSAT